MLSNEETRANAQAVVDYIIEHPENHKQREYFGKMTDSGLESDYDLSENACGTTMCIAGTHLFLKYGTRATKIFLASVNGSIKDAGNDLGLEGMERFKLFHEANEDTAFDLINALAQGDLEKFAEIHVSRGEEIA